MLSWTASNKRSGSGIVRTRGARDSSSHFHLSWPIAIRVRTMPEPQIFCCWQFETTCPKSAQLCCGCTVISMVSQGICTGPINPAFTKWPDECFFLLRPARVKPLVDITAIFETSFPGLAASTAQGGRWSNGQCPACLVTVFPAPPVNRKSLAPARAPEQQKGKTRGGRPNPYEEKTFSIIQLTWLGLPWFSKGRQKCMH